MILTLPELITPEELALVKQLVAGAGFTEGRSTAGELLQKAKNNQQIPWDHPVMKKIVERVGELTFSVDPDLWRSLVGSIVGQQLSVAAARSIRSTPGSTASRRAGAR